MTSLADIFTIVFVSLGAVFFLAGTVGLLRLPNALTRLHALTKADNLGLGLIVLGLMPQAESVMAALKLAGHLALGSGRECDGRTDDGAPCAARGRSIMTLSAVLDGTLAVLVLAAAAWSVFAARSFAASVAFVSFGLLATIVWVRLGAIDVAITEAALGSGLTGVLLLRAAASLRDTAAEVARPAGGRTQAAHGDRLRAGHGRSGGRGAEPTRARADARAGGACRRCRNSASATR